MSECKHGTEQRMTNSRITCPVCAKQRIDDLERQLARYTDGVMCPNCDNLRLELGEIQRQLTKARRGLAAVEALINESHGVTGLHLNSDVAPWDELRTGGRFEGWLVDFDAAIAERPNAKNT